MINVKFGSIVKLILISESKSSISSLKNNFHSVLIEQLKHPEQHKPLDEDQFNLGFGFTILGLWYQFHKFFLDIKVSNSF